MKTIAILILIMFASCKLNVPNREGLGKIQIQRMSELGEYGKPMFTVTTEEGQTRKMNAEEIALSLIEDKWVKDDMLKICSLSEYQLILEDDSLVIYDADRFVGAAHYTQTGILDSIFIKDNQ